MENIKVSCHGLVRSTLCLALVGCSFAAAAISRIDYPDADIVVIDDSTRMEYAADGTYEYENDERILALTEKGQRSLRSVSFNVSRRYGEAEIVKVEIIGTNGVARAVDFKKTLKETTDNSATTSNIYDPLDRRIACAVPGIQVGEVRRVVFRERMFKPRMRDAFAANSLFELTCPIVRSSFEVIAPAERPIVSVKLRHPLDGTVVRSADETLPDGRIRMKWVAENVPQAFPEPDMPTFSSVAQKLLISTNRSWEDVSRWYWNLCRPRLEATNEAMTNKVAELVAGLKTDAERVRSIFKFVSQEIRYMGLTLEDESPGYAPHDVHISFDNRYGICRDKAALLAAMLRIAGIEAYPVLIHVGPKMDEDVPIPYFNHAIAAVANPGGGFTLMDPTNENTKDLLPAYLMNRSYLVAHPKGVPLAVVPVKPAEENAFRAETKGTLEPDGSAVVETVAHFGGVNDLYRSSFVKKTPKERRRSFENVLRSSYPGAELLAFEMMPADLRDTDAPIAVTLKARLPDVVVRGKTRDELTPPFLFSGFAIADRILSKGTELDHRRYPLQFFSTAMAEEKLTIKLGDSVGEPLKIPPDVDEGRNCRYERRISVKDGVLSAVRRRSANTMEISPDEYLELKDDLKSIELGVRKKPQFAAKGEEDETNVKLLYSHREDHLSSPYSWTVTNVWEREVLTYAGKKSSAEQQYSFNPEVGYVEVVSATVSNRSGRVHEVTPKEIHVLDAGWAASAPRYPASKRLVVNLPAVEIGSVIRMTTVSVTTNSPVPYNNLFTFDSDEPIGVEEFVVDGVPLKIACGGSLDRIAETNRFSFAVTNPAALPREGSQPPALFWRSCVLLSAGNLEEFRDSMFGALADAREKGSDNAAATALRLVEGIEAPENRIKAVRDWLWRNVRLAGPGLFSLPFDQAFFPPDRVLADCYGSVADWMNTYFAMLEAIGCDVEFVLSDNDAAGYPEMARMRREVPQPTDFGDLLIRARVRTGGWLFGLFGGEERTFILDYENDCTPIGVRDIDGRNGRVENCMTFDLNETGAARITVSNSTWGVAVASLRKRYSEMLPEMRARHHTELIGDIAESAEAISGLETDVDGYPFIMTYSAYAPNYAAKNGDTLTLVVPGLGGMFLPSAESERKSPFGISGRLRPLVTIRDIVFPEGYTAVEHIPESWQIILPGETEARYESTVSSRIEDGRLHVTFREALRPCNARMFSRDWLGFFRDWNRRTGSRLIRTVIVRRN